MARITIALLLFISITKPGEAATASAASGGTFAAPSSTTPGTASWSWFDPDTFDRITWKSGTNHADATPFTHTDVDELYFRFTIPPPPALLSR